MAAEVTRVVVGHALFEACVGQIEAPGLDAPLQELAVMHHLVVATELRVLVEQRVEAVGALRDDLAHAHAIQHLDVLHREHLEEVLVSRTPGGVASAQLGRAEDGEVDARPFEQPRDGLRHLAVLVVEGARATDPVQVLVVERLGAVDDHDVVEPTRPVGSLALVHTPGVALVLHRPVQRCRAQSGSSTPSATDSGACRGSCRGSRCSQGRSRRTPCTRCTTRSPPR